MSIGQAIVHRAQGAMRQIAMRFQAPDDAITVRIAPMGNSEPNGACRQQNEHGQQCNMQPGRQEQWKFQQPQGQKQTHRTDQGQQRLPSVFPDQHQPRRGLNILYTVG